MDICAYLDLHNITYTRFEHPAVFTCEEATRFLPSIPAVETKNLLLRDEKSTAFFLVSVSAHKRVDLRALGQALGIKRFSMASPAQLKQLLGVDPGSVTLLGLINDEDHKVRVVIDLSVWSAEAVQCHPLVNTATLAIPQLDLRKFFDLTGHAMKIMEVPAAT